MIECNLIRALAFTDRCKLMSSLLYLEGNIGYTFPGRNTELWYRGKVYADRQGRYVESKATIDTYHGSTMMVVVKKKNLFAGIRSKQPIHADTMAGPLYTTITR